MKYHVHTADGRRLDPKSVEEISAALVAGEFTSEGALAWAPGMAGWEPLAGLLGMPPSMPTTGTASTGAGVVGELIPLKNGKALTAYYCAIFGIIPCFTFILGPLALIFGILGLKAVKKDSTMPGKVHAWVGIILGGFETLAVVAWVVLMIIGFAMSSKPH